MTTASTSFAEYIRPISLPIEIWDDTQVDVASPIPLSNANERRVSPSSAQKTTTPINCAEFFRLVGRHRLSVFRGPYKTRPGKGGPLNQGGTYEARWTEVNDDLIRSMHDWRTNPFVLKCQPRKSSYLRPEGSSSVKAGTAVVSKHMRVKAGAQSIGDAHSFLSSLMKEALVLSHHTIQRSLFFPSIFGLTFEDSVSDVLHQSPTLLLEMGDGGNLEEWFRGMWRGKLPWPSRRLQGGRGWLQASESPPAKLVFDWERKIRMATCIASALATLHEAGVVHGDVKMKNIICCPFYPEIQRPHSRQFPQLCDFGSCILLSELPSGSRTKLLSHTPPWNAPESFDDLDGIGLLRTDIYSFGLLLARIFLDGNDPFSEDYHVSSGASAEYDLSQIQNLKENDLVPEHVIKQILEPSDLPVFVEDGFDADRYRPPVIRGDGSGFDGCAYTGAQRSVIRSLMRATLRLSPQRRLGNMRLMVEFLTQAITAEEDQLDRLSNFDWLAESDLKERNAADESMAWVRTDSRILSREALKPQHWIPQFGSEEPTAERINLFSKDFEPICREYFEDATVLRYPDEVGGVPNLLDPTFREMLIDELFTKDLVKDLKRLADSGSAPATLQVAWCYLHGWGGSRSKHQFRQYFKQAVLGQSRAALQHLHLLTSGLPQPLVTGEDMQLLSSPATDALGNALRHHLDLSAMAFLETNFPRYCSKLVMDIRTAKVLDAQIHLPQNLEADEETHLLLDACRIGDSETVEKFLASKDQSGLGNIDETILSAALLQASAHGHGFLALRMLEEGAVAHAVDSLFRTPMHFLARFDHDMVDTVGCVLLEAGASVHARDSGQMPPLAFVLDHERNYLPSSVHAAAQFLIRHGAASEPENLQLAFSRAVLSGDTRQMMIFEDLVNIPTQETSGFTDEQGEMISRVLFNAFLELISGPESSRICKFGGWIGHNLQVDHPPRIPVRDMIRRLVRHIRPELWVKSIARHRALDIISSLEYVPHWPQDPLAPIGRCGFLGDVELASHFFRLGTKFDYVRPEPGGGKNVLHMAALVGWSVETLQALCNEQQQKVDLFEMVNHRATFIHMNPFDQAVLSGHYDVAEFLRNLGADTKSANLAMCGNPACGHEGSSLVSFHPGGRCTLLGLALRGEHMDMQFWMNSVEFLLKMDMDPVIFPDAGLNVFHSIWAPWSIVPRSRIQPESKDIFRNSVPLFNVLWKKFHDKELLEAQEFRGGNTPLIYASSSGNVDGVRRLLREGVNINKANHDGHTALHMTMDHFFFRIDIESIFKSGIVRPPAGKAVVKDMEAYVLLGVIQLLRSRGGIAEGGSSSVAQNLCRCDDNSGTHVCMTDMKLFFDFDTSDPESWGHIVTEYTLVQFSPPLERSDLGSFRIAFIPREWHRLHILPHPESEHARILQGYYERAEAVLDDDKGPRNTAVEQEKEAVAGPSGTQHEPRDIDPSIVRGLKIQDADGSSMIFNRSEPVRHTEDSDRNTPYLQFTIPFCKRVTKIAFRINSQELEEQERKSDLDGEQTYEASHSWFEVGIQNSNSPTSRHLVQRNMQPRGQFELHEIDWNIATASSELRGWLDGLRDGLVIEIYPRATGEGIINQVESMTVELFFED